MHEASVKNTRSLLALLGLSASTGAAATCAAVVVVVVVRRKDFASKFLLSSVDVRVEAIAVFADRELLVIVNWDLNPAGAHGLVLGVVELSNIRMAQHLFCCQSPVRVKL